MRRAALVFGPFTLLAGAIFACEDDPSGAGGPPFLLDGSTPAFDGGQQPFDSGGPNPEASPDAPSGPPSVTVTVTGRTGPAANVRVVFHDASGAVLETKLTDANGKAKSTGALPAMASALMAVGSQHEIMTWTGLEDGDDLVVREPDTYESEERIGTYQVTLPGPFDDTGTTRYDLRVGDCSGSWQGEGPATVSLYRFCVPGDKSSVLVRALDPNYQIIGQSFKKANPVPTDGGTVDVVTSAWAPPSTVTVTATNTPVDQSIDVDLLEIADGYGYADGFSHSLENGSAIFHTANGFAEALQSTLYFYGGSSRQMITKRVAAGPTIEFDASQVLPLLETAEISGTDSRRPVISWTGNTAGTDGGLVRVDFFGAEGGNYHWTFVVPPGSTSVTAPAMPAEADSFLPPATDAGPEAFQWPELVFVEADVIPTYKEFRRMQGALAPAGTSFAFSVPTLPLNGTYRTTSWVLAF